MSGTNDRGLQIDGLEDLVLIGRGGYSDVYRAYQPAFRRTVAVKVLRVPHLTDAVRTRFERECQALGVLSDHPHIVTVLDAGFTDFDDPYLVMSFVPGGSLDDRLRTEPMSWDEATRTGVKMASALVAAHDVGIIHRDVKPANILISAYGEPQLCDFGIARLNDSTSSATGQVTASLSFAAPEMLDGRPATAAADIYGLCATVFTLVAGRPPFDAEESTIPELIARIATEVPDRLTDFGVPSTVADVVHRGLAKDPADRPSSMRELAEQLQDAEGRAGLAVTQLSEATTSERLSRDPSGGSHHTADVPIVTPPAATPTMTAQRPSPPIEEDGSSRDKRSRWLGAAVIVATLLVVAVVVSLRDTSDDVTGDALNAGTSGASIADDVSFVPYSLVCPGTATSFAGQDLRGVDLSSQDLACADFTGAVLDGADLSGSSLFLAVFTDASLIDVNLQGADLRRAQMSQIALAGSDLRGADLSESALEPFSWRAIDLTGANLLLVELMGVDLTEAIVKDTTCPDGTVSSDSCEGHLLPVPPLSMLCPDGLQAPPDTIRTGREISGELRCLDLAGLDLSFATIEDADLSGSDLTGADLQQARLVNVRFRHALLDDADFAGAQLVEVGFVQTDLTKIDLSNAALVEHLDVSYSMGVGADLASWNVGIGLNVTGADLSGADVSGMTFEGSALVDFTGATLRDSRIAGHAYQLILRDADLTGSDLTGAFLDATDLTGATLTDIVTDRVTCNAVIGAEAIC